MEIIILINKSIDITEIGTETATSVSDSILHLYLGQFYQTWSIPTGICLDNDKVMIKTGEGFLYNRDKNVSEWYKTRRGAFLIMN